MPARSPNVPSSPFAVPLPDEPATLLGNLTPAQFMRRYWQKKPLLIRQAIPGIQPPLSRDELFELADSEDAESRLITHFRKSWAMEHGPFAPDELPSVKKRDWTLLVQGVNLHDDRARALLDRFRFIPDARLDDLMISYATDGGGVGAHFDSYDVFLLQVHGKRRWRFGAQRDLSLKEGLPLKVLQHFEADEEWVLEPGDMLYLPPHIAHDGVAEGECMTASIGFRALLRKRTVRTVPVPPCRAPGRCPRRWCKKWRPALPGPYPAGGQPPGAAAAAHDRTGWRDPCEHPMG